MTQKNRKEKKKREAKQQQHQSAGGHQSLVDAELSDSDDEYLPVSVNEAVTDSEHEEDMHIQSRSKML